MKTFNIDPQLRRSAVAPAALAIAQAFCLASPAKAQTQVQTQAATAVTMAFRTAVTSFRQGQLADAYGRFITLAHLGHADSARYALLMCEHGLDLFGRDWDCTPHDVEDWARLAGVPAPRIAARIYPPLVPSRHGTTR